MEYIESDSSLESDNSLDMPVCDDCGIVFGDVHYLQNHVKRWCNKRSATDDQAETPQLKRWISYDQSEEDVEDKDSEEHKVVGVMYRKASNSNEKSWRQKVETYERDGMSNEEAKKKEESKMVA